MLAARHCHFATQEWSLVGRMKNSCEVFDPGPQSKHWSVSIEELGKTMIIERFAVVGQEQNILGNCG